MPTAFDSLSLPDTVFLARNDGGGASDLADDLSQEKTDISYVGPYLIESNSARTALAGNRELAVLVRLTTGDEGTLITHGLEDGSGINTFTIRLDGSDAIEFVQGAEVLSTIDVPDIDATDQIYLVSWCTRVGVTTSWSEFFVRCIDTGGSTFKSARHLAPTTNAAWTFSIGGTYDGHDPFTDTSRIDVVRVGKRFHSTEEQRQHFWGPTSAPTLETGVRAELLPVSNDTDLGAAGAFYGPATVHAHAQLMQADRRLYGPLVSESFPYLTGGAEALSNAFAPATWNLAPPDRDDLRLTLQYGYYVALAPAMQKARVRVHVTTWATSGAAVEIYLALYSLSRSPTAPADFPFTYARTSIEALTADDGSITAEGRWIDLGVVNLKRNKLLRTMLVLAYGFDADAANVANQRIRVNALTVEPLVQTVENGLDLAG